MIPFFSIVGGSARQTIIDSLNDRFVSCSVVDNAGYMNDRLVLQIDDRPPFFKVPVRGDTLSVQMGYMQGPRHDRPSDLLPMGTFIIDEIEWDYPPATISITAHASDTNDRYKQPRSKSWHRVKLQTIIEDCANYCGLSALVHVELKDKEIEHEDQVNQSCGEFLRVFTEKNNAIMKVQDETILIAPKGKTHQLIGTLIRPRVLLSMSDCSQIHYVSQSKSRYRAVKAKYSTYDGDKSFATTQVTVKDAIGRDSGDTSEGVIDPVSVFTLPGTFVNAREARDAALSKMRSLALSECGFGFTCIGNPKIVAESNVIMAGLRPGIPVKWRVVRVTHTLDGSGFTSQVECEAPDNMD